MHLSTDDVEGEFSVPLFLFLALRTLLVLSLGVCLTHFFGFPLFLSLLSFSVALSYGTFCFECVLVCLF